MESSDGSYLIRKGTVRIKGEIDIFTISFQDDVAISALRTTEVVQVRSLVLRKELNREWNKRHLVELQTVTEKRNESGTRASYIINGVVEDILPVCGSAGIEAHEVSDQVIVKRGFIEGTNESMIDIPASDDRITR